MTLGESIIAILAVSITVWVGGWLFRKLRCIGERIELQIQANELEKSEKMRKDLFD